MTILINGVNSPCDIKCCERYNSKRHKQEKRKG